MCFFVADPDLQSGTKCPHLPKDPERLQKKPCADAAALVSRLYRQPKDSAFKGPVLKS